MTTLRTIELQCPACETQFHSQAAAPTSYRFGAKETDFREPAFAAQALAYQVHTCTHCGYSGDEHHFAPGAAIPASVVDHVLADLTPPLDATLVGSEKHDAAAKVAKWQGAEPRHVADLLLRAAWCCIDEGDEEAERYYRRLAAWKFEEALEAFHGVAAEDRAVIVYLVGELWRRVGDDVKSAAWFDRVTHEVTDAAAQQWIVDAAQQQKSEPRERFA